MLAFWILLIVALTVAAIDDIRKREVERYTYIFLFFIAFFAMNFSILSSIVDLVVCFAAMLAAAMISDGDLGGGDVKFSGLTGWLLGWQYGLTALLVGCISCIVVIPVLKKLRVFQSKSIPLIPFFGVGIVVSIIIKTIRERGAIF